MTIARVKNWETRLYFETLYAMEKAHSWGEHDCVTFAADCIRAMTDRDLMADFRGSYDGPIGAAALIRQFGVEGVGDLAAIFLPEISPGQARRGDIIVATEPHEFLAVCVGRTAVGPSETGMIHVPMDQALRAFRVGD